MNKPTPQEEFMIIINRDRLRQEEENTRRMETKLRIEYRDFISILSTDMTSDLGENMRIQLGNVFSILEEFGFNLN